MTKRDVARVVGAETRTAHGHPMSMTFAPRVFEYVAHDHVFVSVVSFHPVGRMNSLVVETVEIDRVRAINRDLAGIDVGSDRTDETEIFVLIITAERRRKQNQGQTAAVS